MSQILIGVVGGYGAVGEHAARWLAAAGLHVRVGGRDAARAERVCRDLPAGRAHARRVDVDDEASLRAFCSECEVVLNCAGPSERILDRVALVAFDAGADYVDAYGTDRAYERIRDVCDRGGRRAVLGAGEMPGLSGLLPRWLATQGFERVERLTAYVGGIEPMSQAAALDYLLGAEHGHGEALCAISGGARAARALMPRSDLTLPFFPPGVTAYPYLSHEAERLAHALSLRELHWYNVFDGTHGVAALAISRQQMLAGASAEAAAASLRAAAQLDLFGRTTYQVLLFELQGQPCVRTLYVRAASGAALSGWFAAFAVGAVSSGRVESGAHYASEALAPADVIPPLRAAGVLQAFELIDGRACETSEEGSL